MAITVTKQDHWAEALPGVAEIIARAIAERREAPKRELAEAIQFVERTGAVPDEATMQRMFPNLAKATSYASIAEQLHPIAKRAELALQLMQKDVDVKGAAIKLTDAQIRQIDRQAWLDEAHKNKIYADIEATLNRTHLDKEAAAIARDQLALTYANMLQDARFREAYLKTEGRVRDLTLQLGLHNAKIQYELQKMAIAAQMGQQNATATSESIEQITKLMQTMGATAQSLKETDSKMFKHYAPYLGEAVQLSVQELRRLTGASDIAGDPTVVKKAWKLADVFADLPLKLFGINALSADDRKLVEESAQRIKEASGNKLSHEKARERAFELFMQAHEKAKEQARAQATPQPVSPPQAGAPVSAIGNAFDKMDAHFDNMYDMLGDAAPSGGVVSDEVTNVFRDIVEGQKKRDAAHARTAEEDRLAIQLLQRFPNLTLDAARERVRRDRNQTRLPPGF